MMRWSKKNIVLISERTIPEEFRGKFEVVWKKNITTTHHSQTKIQTEKLYLYKYMHLSNR